MVEFEFRLVTSPIFVFIHANFWRETRTSGCEKSPLVFMFSTTGCKKSSANSNSTEKLYLQLRRTGSKVRLTSRTAEPTVLAIGLPPNVLKVRCLGEGLVRSLV